MPGEVVTIFITAEAAGPMREVDAVMAHANKGLEGDRYMADAGTFSKTKPGPRRQVTLIEAEAVDAAARDYGLELRPSETRRNILTRDVALNHLVGREFRVGQARLRGIKLCEPCAHLDKVVGRQVSPALVHRGGLNAEVLETGLIQAGDPVLPA